MQSGPMLVGRTGVRVALHAEIRNQGDAGDGWFGEGVRCGGRGGDDGRAVDSGGFSPLCRAVRFCFGLKKVEEGHDWFVLLFKGWSVVRFRLNADSPLLRRYK
jgi:hypothetical protein